MYEGNVLDRWLARAFRAVAARTSANLVFPLAVAFALGVGLLIPLGLGLPTGHLVLVNVLAVLVSLAFLAVWMGNHADARDRRRLLEWTTDLRRLSAEEFEWLVGEIHRREGWRVEETGSQDGPDGNVDLILTREGTRVLVQCKRWQSRKVGTEEVRSFAGVLRRNGESASGGIFVTLSRFTEYAEREARELGIALVDGTQLHRLIEQHRRSEMCPECDHPMRLDKSRYGWWFRCTKHGCSGKRDLSAEPHRAIELLTMLPPAARR